MGGKANVENAECFISIGMKVNVSQRQWKKVKFVVKRKCILVITYSYLQCEHSDSKQFEIECMFSKFSLTM